MTDGDVTRIDKNQREILERLRSIEVDQAVLRTEVNDLKQTRQRKLLNPWWTATGGVGGGAAVWEFLRRFGGE